MHQQVAGIVDQEIADGSPVDCKKQDERQKLRDKAYRLFVDRCRGLDHGNNQPDDQHQHERSEEHTSELQSLMRNSYAVFCLKKKKDTQKTNPNNLTHTKHTIKR